jgi:hypothetical protein
MYIFAKFLVDHIFLQNRDKKYIKKFTKSAGSTWHGGLARGPSAQQAYLASGPLMGRSELIDGAGPPRNDGPPKFDSPSDESWELSLSHRSPFHFYRHKNRGQEGTVGERFVFL